MNLPDPTDPSLDPESERVRLLHALSDEVRKKEDLLKRSLSTLHQHYTGVIILAYVYDPETEACISRFVTAGDPFALRYMAGKFVRELEHEEQAKIAKDRK